MTQMLQFDAETARRIEAVYTTPDVVDQRRVVMDVLALTPGERVVDVGAGPGFLAAEMTAVVGPGQVYAVDPSASMRSLAGARGALTNEGRNTRSTGPAPTTW